MARSRRRLVVLFVSLLCVTAVVSCNSKPSTTTSPTPGGGTPAPTPTTGSISGTITDASTGAPLSNVTVSGGGKTATTGADGRYTLSDLALGPVTLTIQRQGHRNTTQAVTVTAGTITTNVIMTPAIVAGFQGTWTGAWTNTTFGSTGPASARVTADTIAQTIQIVFDLGGNVFGRSDPPAETFTFPYTSAGGTFTGTSPSYGTINITVSPTGGFSGNLTNIPGGGISRVDFTGTATPQSLTATTTIHFVGGGTANSTLTLSKQGGASTLSVVAAQLKAGVRTLLD